METNEQIRRVLSKALEEELESFLEQVSQMTEGELKHLEKQVVKSSQAIGRKLMEGVLNSRLHERRPVARREGSCGHVQRLVGERPKELITLVGAVSGCRARTINACMEEKRKRSKTVRMEKRLLMRCGAWTSSARPLGCKGTSVSLRARLTFEEAAQTLCRSVPIGMSGRQALNLMRPVGEALAASEAQQVMALEAEARQARSLPTERQQQTAIERLYIELDGVLARMRRGSVPMEHEEVQRKGDVYREIKAGAVFRAEQGPKRSELAPGVYVDTPAEDSLRYVARRTAKGGFGWLLYQLALDGGLEQAKQVVVLGDGAPWIWNLAAEHFPGAVQILDLYHAKEHVWDVAHAVFGRGTAAGTAWAT